MSIIWDVSPMAPDCLGLVAWATWQTSSGEIRITDSEKSQQNAFHFFNSHCEGRGKKGCDSWAWLESSLPETQHSPSNFYLAFQWRQAIRSYSKILSSKWSSYWWGHLKSIIIMIKNACWWNFYLRTRVKAKTLHVYCLKAWFFWLLLKFLPH